MPLHYSPFPNLSTERLILRELTFEDEKEIFMLRSDDNVNKYLDRQKAETINDVRMFIESVQLGLAKGESIMWAITIKGEPRLIGTICLWKISREQAKAEIGYELIPRYQGKGYMQEAVREILKYGFEIMNLRVIEAELSPNNLQSVKLLEKNHFVKVVNLLDAVSDIIENPDSVVYRLENSNLDKSS